MDSLIPFTTSGSLMDCVDKKMLVVLRDGRKVIGVLRSYDQFANLVLSGAIERIHHPPSTTYADIPRGVYLIRGENVVLMGEIDLELEDEPPVPMRPDNIVTVAQLHRESEAMKEKLNAVKNKILHERGFSTDVQEGDNY